jgi:hypothetical protein
MSRKGHFLGGSTTIGPRDPSWFKKGSTRVPPNDGAPKPPLSIAEKAAFEALKKSKEVRVRLIPKGEKKKRKSRLGKSKAVTKKPPAIKREPSVPHKDLGVVRQKLQKGRSREVAVEFVSDRKSNR